MNHGDEEVAAGAPSSRPSSHAHRRTEIADFVKARGGARIDELADQFGVSIMTIHRDLDHLHAKGMLRKVRSGAEAPPSEAFERNVELRKSLNLAEKQAVASAGFDWAASRIEMQAIAVDDSTTALHVLPLLTTHMPLTVVTNFLPAINELSAEPKVRLNAIGGDFVPEFSSFVGPQSVRALRDMHYDVLFMSVPAVSRGMCFHPSSPAADLKRAFMESAELRVLLLDHTKLARRAIHRICDLTDFDAVVVDDGADAQELERLADSGVNIVVARRDSDHDPTRRCSRRRRRATMTSPLVIAVDCSTTAAKAIVVDPDGHVLASGSHALATRSPAPHRFEQHAADWWTATDSAIRQALDELEDRSAVAAVCVTHQRESFVCLDEHDQAMRPAILWMDGRAEHEARQYGSPRVELLSGKPADITPGLYKLLWLRDHEPETIARCRRVADVHTYLVHAMTGRWSSSTASVDPLALLDQATGDYSDELLELAVCGASNCPNSSRREHLSGRCAPTSPTRGGSIAKSWWWQERAMARPQGSGSASPIRERPTWYWVPPWSSAARRRRTCLHGPTGR